MKWTIEYYEQQDTTQPAEIFEDDLFHHNSKLAGKLARIAIVLQTYGHQLGGGLIEPCHDYRGIWEMRAIYEQWLGREFFGFDGSRIILLHGYVKRTGQAAIQKELKQAAIYWQDYQKTHKVSPIQEENNEQV